MLTLPAACAAGNYAIGFAADLIRSGKADVVVTGAAEMLQELQYSGFVRLAAMAPAKCQPFDLNRQGLILGEGAGILVLESEAHATRRKAATLLAEVGGHGMTCDAYHITRPHPDAIGSIGAMRQAIERSGITPDAIDFVNAHGTGTKHNDAAESKVMKDIFGDRKVPISSMKSMLGHCMGAASALEAIGCIMTLETGVYPPTIGYETPDPGVRRRRRRQRRAHGRARHRAQQLARVRRLQLGHLPREARTSSPTLAPFSRAARPEPMTPRFVTGLGIACALGTGSETFFRELADAKRLSGAAAPRRSRASTLSKYPDARIVEVPDFDPTKYLGDKGLRTLDRLTKLLVVAARLCLHDAGIKKDDQWVALAPERVGVVLLERLRQPRGHHRARSRRASSRTPATSTPRSSRTPSRTARAATSASGRTSARST